MKDSFMTLNHNIHYRRSSQVAWFPVRFREFNILSNAYLMLHKSSLEISVNDSCMKVLPDMLVFNGVAFSSFQHKCAAYKPCWNDRCVNTVPGYQCLHCPAGYRGTLEDAIGRKITLRVFEEFNQQHAALTYQVRTPINWSS